MKKAGIFLLILSSFLLASCLNNPTKKNQVNSGKEQQFFNSVISSEDPGKEEKQIAENFFNRKLIESLNVNQPTYKITEQGFSIGAYILDIELTDRERWQYEISISTDNGKSRKNSKAIITSRPVPYYCDEDYFILKVDAEPGETDSLGNYGNCVFLLYNKADKGFQRLVSKAYEVYSFRVFGEFLYCGVHEPESDHGYISISNIATGEIRYCHKIDDGSGPSLISAWAPQVQLNSDDKLRVWLEENDNQNYIFDGDILIPADQERPQPFFYNDDIPLDF